MPLDEIEIRRRERHLRREADRSDIIAHVLDVATATGQAADQALKIASRLLDGRQAAGRGPRQSVALEMAHRDAADLTDALRERVERILDPGA